MSRYGVTWRCHTTVSRYGVTWRCHVTVSHDGVTQRCHMTVSRYGVTWRCHVTVSRYGVTWRYHVTVSRHATSLFSRIPESSDHSCTKLWCILFRVFWGTNVSDKLNPAAAQTKFRLLFGKHQGIIRCWRWRKQFAKKLVPVYRTALRNILEYKNLRV